MNPFFPLVDFWWAETLSGFTIKLLAGFLSERGVGLSFGSGQLIGPRSPWMKFNAHEKKRRRKKQRRTGCSRRNFYGHSHQAVAGRREEYKSRVVPDSIRTFSSAFSCSRVHA
ncbi:hypothetical protein ACMFMF_010052 [Clarireedia jacksonii]